MLGPRGEDTNERAYSATRRTKVVSTPATEPRMRSLLSGSTIVSVLLNVMSSGLSGRLDAMASHSSESHKKPSNQVQSENVPRMEEASEIERLARQVVALDGFGHLDPVLRDHRGVDVDAGAVGLERRTLHPVEIPLHLNGELQVLP